jgi:hypothetical protein
MVGRILGVEAGKLIFCISEIGADLTEIHGKFTVAAALG